MFRASLAIYQLLWSDSFLSFCPPRIPRYSSLFTKLMLSARLILTRKPLSLAKHATRTRSTASCLTRSVSTAVSRPYRFHTGASWAGKPKDPGLRFQTTPFPKDHPIARWREEVLSRPNRNGRHIGEDFFYVQEVCATATCIYSATHQGSELADAKSVGTTLHFLLVPRFLQPSTTLQGVSLGIADGVGGWVESGVDPSLFSQSLMYHAHRYAQSGWPGEPEIDPTSHEVCARYERHR